MIDIVERNEVVQFKNGDFVLDVTIDSNKETVWLNREQLSQLFDRDIKTIGRHINIVNIIFTKNVNLKITRNVNLLLPVLLTYVYLFRPFLVFQHIHKILGSI